MPKTPEQIMADIIVDTMRFLAEKHGTTFDVVFDEIMNGNIKLKSQFDQLMGLAGEFVKNQVRA